MAKNTKKLIIATEVTSEKGNQVWRVSVEGSRNKNEIGYCRTPLAAIRMCYRLKAQTGCMISRNSMKYLCFLNASSKVDKSE